jgi:hypothetical protein
LPEQHKIPVGPLIASIGAVLLIVSLFLDWYERVTGWTIYEVVDLALAGLALWTIYSMVADMGLVKPAAGPGATVAAAVLAFVIVVTQVLNDPPAVAGRDGPEQDIGIWLALAGSALMLAGALVATTRISLAVEARGPAEARGAGARDERTEPRAGEAPAVPGGPGEPRAPRAEPSGPRRGDEPTRPLGESEHPPRGPERP